MLRLKEHIRLIENLKRQHEIAALRYYRIDACMTIIELIINEIRDWPETEIIPDDIYISLCNVDKLIVNGISDLCLLYRKIILITEKYS